MIIEKNLLFIAMFYRKNKMMRDEFAIFVVKYFVFKLNVVVISNKLEKSIKDNLKYQSKIHKTYFNFMMTNPLVCTLLLGVVLIGSFPTGNGHALKGRYVFDRFNHILIWIFKLYTLYK